MSRIFKIAAIALLFNMSASAQETPKPCGATYEVNAGPDIDVCESGIVGVNGILAGDATRGVWRGGKGVFTPDRNSIAMEYTPDSSEYGNTVMLTLVGDNPNFPDCPKGRDDIQIRVNMQPKVEAGKNKKVCQAQPVPLQGKLLSGKAQRLQWTSNGTGTFDDASKEDAIYTPSDVDAGLGAIVLTFKAYAFGVCLNDSDMIALTVVPMPVITMPSNLKGTGMNPIALNAKVQGGTKLTWTSSGNGKIQSASKATATYIPSTDDLSNGRVTLTLSAKGEMNCSSEKSVTITLTADQ